MTEGIPMCDTNTPAPASVPTFDDCEAVFWQMSAAFWAGNRQTWRALRECYVAALYANEHGVWP